MALASGTRLGGYEIQALIGVGGMGEVYRAFDTKLNRPVAVKILSDDLGESHRRRFERESRAALSLNHPHLVTVLDIGEFEGRQFLVTELIAGGTLRDWMRAPRTWEEIVELLVDVADDHDAGDDAARRDSRHRRVHVAGAGEGQARRQAQ